MVAWMIRSKGLVLHDIIPAEIGAAPIIMAAFWELPEQSYSRVALMSSKQLAEHGDIHCS